MPHENWIAISGEVMFDDNGLFYPSRKLPFSPDPNIKWRYNKKTDNSRISIPPVCLICLPGGDFPVIRRYMMNIPACFTSFSLPAGSELNGKAGISFAEAHNACLTTSFSEPEGLLRLWDGG